MDEEKEGQSLGAYENMERSDIRPEFFDAVSEEKNEGSGDAQQNTNSGFAKDLLKSKEQKAANGAAKKIISKVGGAEGKAIAKGMDIAEKAGVVSGIALAFKLSIGRSISSSII